MSLHPEQAWSVTSAAPQLWQIRFDIVTNVLLCSNVDAIFSPCALSREVGITDSFRLAPAALSATDLREREDRLSKKMAAEGEAQAILTLMDFPDMILAYISTFFDVRSLASMEAVDQSSKRSIHGNTSSILQ